MLEAAGIVAFAYAGAAGALRARLDVFGVVAAGLSATAATLAVVVLVVTVRMPAIRFGWSSARSRNWGGG